MAEFDACDTAASCSTGCMQATAPTTETTAAVMWITLHGSGFAPALLFGLLHAGNHVTVAQSKSIAADTSCFLMRPACNC
jgi:hypothetical protein